MMTCKCFSCSKFADGCEYVFNKRTYKLSDSSKYFCLDCIGNWKYMEYAQLYGMYQRLIECDIGHFFTS